MLFLLTYLILMTENLMPLCGLAQLGGIVTKTIHQLHPQGVKIVLCNSCKDSSRNFTIHGTKVLRYRPTRRYGRYLPYSHTEGEEAVKFVVANGGHGYGAHHGKPHVVLVGVI